MHECVKSVYLCLDYENIRDVRIYTPKLSEWKASRSFLSLIAKVVNDNRRVDEYKKVNCKINHRLSQI